jgi:hypothetical protein
MAAYLSFPVSGVVDRVRVHAMLCAVASIHISPYETPFTFEGDGDAGWWGVSRGAEGNYLLGWSERGVVGLGYSMFDDPDEQAGKWARGEATPEIVLRSPERSSRGGVPVPHELESLALAAENRVGGLASFGFWASATSSSVREGNLATLGPFEPYTWEECDPVDGGVLADGKSWDGWAFELGLQPPLVQLARSLAERPWRPRSVLSAEEGQVLMLPEAPLGQERGEQRARERRAATLLGSLGIEWNPSRKPLTSGS